MRSVSKKESDRKDDCKPVSEAKTVPVVVQMFLSRQAFVQHTRGVGTGMAINGDNKTGHGRDCYRVSSAFFLFNLCKISPFHLGFNNGKNTAITTFHLVHDIKTSSLTLDQDEDPPACQMHTMSTPRLSRHHFGETGRSSSAS